MWHQCTEALQSVVKGSSDYELKATKHNILWLLGGLKKVVSGVDVKSNPYVTMSDSLDNLVNISQQPNESSNSYKERLDSNIHTVEMAKAGHIFLRTIC